MPEKRSHVCFIALILAESLRRFLSTRPIGFWFFFQIRFFDLVCQASVNTFVEVFGVCMRIQDFSFVLQFIFLYCMGRICKNKTTYEPQY